MQFLSLLAYVAANQEPQAPEGHKEAQLQPQSHLQPVIPRVAQLQSHEEISKPLNSTPIANGPPAIPISVAGLSAVVPGNVAAGLGPQTLNNGQKVGAGLGIVVVSVYLLL
jgi:hypothetical protein